MAFAFDLLRLESPVKELDLDNPEARRRFIEGEV
jgi:hypothetical protein